MGQAGIFENSNENLPARAARENFRKFAFLRVTRYTPSLSLKTDRKTSVLILYCIRIDMCTCDAHNQASRSGYGSGAHASRLWNSSRARAEVFNGGIGPHERVNIASRSLRSRRGRLRGKILRLRRDARRSARARRASDEGAVARANGPGGWPRDLAVMLDGGFGPRVTIDIASRSLRPRRGHLRGIILRLQRDAGCVPAGARPSALEFSVGGLEYQCRLFGGFEAQKCVY